MTLTSSTASSASKHAGCAACGFTLWRPLMGLSVSTVGLYDDARFPGRCLLTLHEHFDDLCALPAPLLAAFMDDLRAVSTAVQRATRAPKVNYAVLGNQERHVHWHVVPRQPEREPRPHHSPWDDPRPLQPLDDAENLRLESEIRRHLNPSPA